MKLPALNARKVLKALRKAGFAIERQKGSHVVLKNYSTGRRTVVPKHSGKTIKMSLLHGIIDDTGLSEEEFLKLI